MINIVHTLCSHRGYTALKTNVSHWELAEWPPDFWQLRKVYLSQTIVGILGIFSLLYLYLFLYYSKCRLRHTDSILKHLTTVTSWAFPLKVSQRQGQPLVEACLLWLSIIHYCFLSLQSWQSMSMDTTCPLSVSSHHGSALGNPGGWNLK